MDIFQVNLLKKIVLFRLKLPKINKAEAVNGAYFITTQLKSNKQFETIFWLKNTNALCILVHVLAFGPTVLYYLFWVN